MSYDQMRQLAEEVSKLNKTLDDRVSAIEAEQKRRKEDKLISKTATVPGDEQENIDTINAEISAKIAEYKAVVAEQKELKLAEQRPGYAGNYAGKANNKPEETKALEKWMRARGDASVLSMDERKLIDFNFMPPERKVLTSALADTGGFFAGTDLSSKFIQKLFLISPFRMLADAQTIGGEKLLIPSEGSTDTNIFWSDEQSGYQASTDPTLGMLEIYARELNGYLKLAVQNLEDSQFDIEGFIMKRLTRQFAQKEGTAFLLGNGYARPEGILTNTAVTQITTASAGAINPADIVILMHTPKSGYRNSPDARWIMANKTVGVLRLFKDSQNRPLWIPFGGELQEVMYGKPIVEMYDMVEPESWPTTTFTSGDLPIAFGDFKQAYQIVDRVGLTFQTLKELYAIQNQVAYLARMRVGGKVVLPEAYAVLKIQ